MWGDYMAKYKKMHSINRIKNSKSKSIKHVKRGRKGKDCIYFNHEKLTCLHPLSPYHNCFCNSKECGFYKDKSPSKKPSLNHCQNRDDLSEFDRNYYHKISKAALMKEPTNILH